MPWIIQTGFGSGQLSPQMRGRTEEGSPARNGLILLENCVIGRAGSARRRDGFRFVASVADSTKNVLIHDFTLTAGRFIAVFNNGKIRFIKNRAVILSGGSPYELAHPYAEADLEELQVTQYQNEIWITHRSHYPRRLLRVADNNWTLDPTSAGAFLSTSLFDTIGPVYEIRARETSLAVNNITPALGRRLTANEGIFTTAMYTPNRDLFFLNGGWCRVDGFVNAFELIVGILQQPPASTEATNEWVGNWRGGGNTGVGITTTAGSVGDTITLTAASALFAASDIGRVIKMEANVDTTHNQYVQITEFTSATVVRGVNINVNISASAKAQSEFYDPQNLGSGGADVTFTPGAVTGATTLTASAPYFTSSMAPSGGNPGARFRISNGVVAVTSFVSTTIVNVTVIKTLSSVSPTNVWEEETNADKGYPGACSDHQGRLIFGGENGQVWGSKTNKVSIFKAGALDSDPLNFLIADARGRVLWLASAGDLLGGTSDGEFAIKGTPLTPSNIGIDRQSSYGGKSVLTAIVGPAVLFTTRDGRSIREMVFRFQEDKYLAPDLTDLAQDLFETSQIKKIAYQRGAEVVWTVLDNGSLLAFSYRRQNGINGWSPIVLGGYSDAGRTTRPLVESVAATAAPVDLGEDEIYIVTKRYVNGAVVKWIEAASASQFTDGCLKNTAYASGTTDAKLTISGTTLTGLSHLAGESVWVKADGVFLGDFTVSGGGQIDLSSKLTGAPSSAEVGLSYSPILKPRALEILDRVGSTALRAKTITRARAYFIKTIAPYADGYELTGWRETGLAAGSPPAVFTGWLESSGPASQPKHDDTTVAFSNNGPYPFEVAAVGFLTEAENL